MSQAVLPPAEREVESAEAGEEEALGASEERARSKRAELVAKTLLLKALRTPAAYGRLLVLGLRVLRLVMEAVFRGWAKRTQWRLALFLGRRKGGRAGGSRPIARANGAAPPSATGVPEGIITPQGSDLPKVGRDDDTVELRAQPAFA